MISEFTECANQFLKQNDANESTQLTIPYQILGIWCTNMHTKSMNCSTWNYTCTITDYIKFCESLANCILNISKYKKLF